MNISSETKAQGDHAGHVLSQWETALQCNVVSHWMSTYADSSQSPPTFRVQFCSEWSVNDSGDKWFTATISTHWLLGNVTIIFETICTLITEKSCQDIHGDIVLRWMSQNLTIRTSILVRVMAWYRQATSRYLNQCWCRSMSAYGVTLP